MSGPSSTYDRLVGLHVTDEELYGRYREGMTPILESYGGFFRYDFTIAEVLRSATPEPINRLFIISFPDAAAHDAFFSDEAYGAVREEFFDLSVATITPIAQYETT